MAENLPSDDFFMARAIELAMKGKGHTRPNPAVGAVIVKDGRIIGEGWHKRAGGDHAEVAAIKNAFESGANTLEGATIYVTLEPCSKPGRVGACTDAIKAAGLSEAVYAVSDPNPINADRAAKVLLDSGVKCRKASCSPEIIAKAQELVADFAKHVTTGMPYVIVKIAMTLDGKICDFNGDAKWISSADARRKTGLLRERVDAIMVGAHTVRMDNPSLLSHGEENPDLIRVVVSRSGDLPRNAQIFTDGKNKTLVFDDAKKALEELGKMGVTSVLCEGGFELASYLALEGLVDKWIAVLAPKVIGKKPIGEAVTLKDVVCLQDW
ncbi:MAG: bifunctional diaminohydroxyphosphoribosylaminopyrimidine deaminase/5-amino-6-(5-phosphoribosylamino)uracil reductase RibD [Kiritimatiellae bacterium]|nr:bifunctional diaminohydroxyphosphoribosylaminopyrimidine deaminase/5-amino-6-(5-phosphoribosylamino)uracil reductase RibD [Kiritimatiellia bacterium]